MPERGQFMRPAPWGIGAGPDKVRSIAHAEDVVAAWLDRTPVRPEYAEERERILALRQILRHNGSEPSEANLQSAKLAIKGFVRFVRLREGRRHAAYSSHRATPPP